MYMMHSSWLRPINFPHQTTTIIPGHDKTLGQRQRGSKRARLFVKREILTIMVFTTNVG